MARNVLHAVGALLPDTSTLLAGAGFVFCLGVFLGVQVAAASGAHPAPAVTSATPPPVSTSSGGVVLQGSGEQTTNAFDLTAGYVEVSVAQKGGGMVTANLLAEDGLSAGPVFTATMAGPYKVLQGVERVYIPADGRYQFEVLTTGKWKVSVKPDP